MSVLRWRWSGDQHQVMQVIVNFTSVWTNSLSFSQWKELSGRENKCIERSTNQAISSLALSCQKEKVESSRESVVLNHSPFVWNKGKSKGIRAPPGEAGHQATEHQEQVWRTVMDTQKQNQSDQQKTNMN